VTHPREDAACPGYYSSTGCFVALEGGEGAGKSTQAERLARWLRDSGHEVVLTREPGATPVGTRLRDIVLDPATGPIAARTEALLYAADKAEHVERVVRPALERGAVVVTDRYVDSTLAYQGAGRDLAQAELERLARWATADLRPHLTVLLDLAPAEGMARFTGRDRIEAESVEFHRRVRASFLAMAGRQPAHYAVVDAGRTTEEVEAAVRAAVRPVLGALLRSAG
jgi:dTMP kinase